MPQRWSLMTKIILLFSYMGLIFYVSSLTIDTRFFPISYIDKFYHALEYSILGFLWALVVFHRTRRFFWAVWLGWLMGTLFGVSDEFHQYFVIGRGSELSDIFADSLGSLIGGLIAYRWLAHLPKSSLAKTKIASFFHPDLADSHQNE